MGHQRVMSSRALLITFAVLVAAAVALPGGHRQTLAQHENIAAIVPEDTLLDKIGFSNLTACADAPEHETALYLQGFLGFWGAAYGYLDRWDWFAFAFIPAMALMLVCCIRAGCQKAAEDDKSGVCCCMNCLIGVPFCIISSVLSVYCLALWIYGLVEICNHNFKDANGCP